MPKDRYGIVIDSGSSGSRVQIYRWPDSEDLRKNGSTDYVLRSIPQIYQEESWSFKITPGVSTFGDKPNKVWDDHYEDLIEYAEKIIPKESWDDTPIFVQATAGMRLLPEKKRQNLLYQICQSISEHSQFKLNNCDEQVQIIDGETEGLYGWIALNYLMGQLDNFDPNDSSHPSYGFMDMGGASTQVSFVPNKNNQIEKHREDISTLYLRNINGDVQKWDIFVSTWLGFGANEARKRYLKNLINILPEKNNNNDEDDFITTKINDPCLPKGAFIDFLHDDHTYDVIGSGDYEQCLKTTYPLLLKNLPCIDEPCLFNGVHAPEIDFYKDKFVGVSEYWYTANDVFHMGGDYNFLKFSEKVRDFCESDWNSIEANSANGEYNNLPNSLLLDACFKANWLLNVLHEGFNLPRGGIETYLPDTEETAESLDNNHIPFQSAGTIKGSELSWTLGRIILYASSLIALNEADNTIVGIQPSENEKKEFIFGGITRPRVNVDQNRDYDSLNFVPIFFIFTSLSIFLYLFLYKKSALKTAYNSIFQTISSLKKRYENYKYLKISNQVSTELEEGIFDQQITAQHRKGAGDMVSGSLSPSLSGSDIGMTNLRTRSFANLQSSKPQTQSSANIGSSITPAAFVPKKQLRTANSYLDFGSSKNENSLKKTNSTNSITISHEN